MAQIEAGERLANAEAVSELDSEGLYLALETWFREDKEHSEEWRDNAKKNFDFVANEMWQDATKRKMEDEGRVAISWNQTAPLINAVSGIEVNTRHEITYLPRGVEEGDIIANESLTQASQWMGDGCNAKRNESSAFTNSLMCGMGWTEERMDYEEDPDGKYIEENIDPLECYWDCASRQMNLADSRRRWRARRIALVDARAKFPDFSDDDLDCSWVTNVPNKAPKTVEERRMKLDNSSRSTRNGMVTIVQCQWWEREKYYRVAKPDSDQVSDISEGEFKTLQKRLKDLEKQTGQSAELTYTEATRKVYKQAFIGRRVLKVGPCPRKNGFTLNCITGKLHHTKRIWLGLVDALKEPQMMLNKWLSQSTHIINATAKGGVIAEADAFDDIREAQETWASPDAITIVKKEAISRGKIMAKPGVGLAGPYFQLIQMAMDALPRVTGINMELLGLRDAQQAGVLEAQRKQAAMTILATWFDSLAGFRVEVGRTRLYFIQNYLADGRLIRILGENGGYKALRLMKDRVVGEYDVIVDEAPRSPNQKEATWAIIERMMSLPVVQQMMTPEVAVTLLKYSPLPSQLVEAFEKMLAQPNPEADKARQIEERGRLVEIDKDSASAMKDRAQADKLKADTVLSLAQAANEQAQAAATSFMPTAPQQPQFGAPVEEFAVTPIGSNTRQLQGPPELPTSPEEAMALAAMMDQGGVDGTGI
ncbi:hypothetical protein [Filomicrobium sp.]|uniref:portal protein n=1 Tax=Filomicrobium sp. TaxID=2024831 RepID=UPI0025882894|nr:hypothetical protein [Filomicrobium sp.]MCV0371727.1 hypothetical protein [Filomicrobium sp.]